MAETFLYFAYGSNMLSRRLKDRRRAPSAEAERIGFVKGHRLTFDKVSTDGSGKCDMEASANPAEEVLGVLFKVNAAEETQLDAAEGLGSGYSKRKVEVTTSEGSCTAIAYVADKKDHHLLPYHWYKALVVAGAEEHGLPVEYIAKIRKVISQADPNDQRRLENEAILASE